SSLTFFLYNAAGSTEIYTLSLHDALPIWEIHGRLGRLTHLIKRVGNNSDDFVIGVSVRNDVEMLAQRVFAREILLRQQAVDDDRSEEHTSELQSLRHLVCRLLLEKKK